MASNAVLVLGAGELGSEVLKSLATHPARAGRRIAVLRRQRRPSQGASDGVVARNDMLADLDVEVRYGDVTAMSEEQIAEMMHDFSIVISCNGMTLPPDTQIKLAKAAIKGEVKRYFPWQFGLDYDQIGRKSSQNLFDAQLDVRDILRSQSAMDWIIVSTGMFTSFLFEPAFGVISADRTVVTALGSWDNRITVTSPPDIGHVTAELVFAAPDIKGVVYTVGDTISMQRLADTIEAMLGHPVERQLATVTELEAQLADDPEDGMKKYRAVFARGIGVAWDKEVTFNARRGISMQSVEAWARANMKVHSTVSRTV